MHTPRRGHVCACVDKQMKPSIVHSKHFERHKLPNVCAFGSLFIDSELVSVPLVF